MGSDIDADVKQKIRDGMAAPGAVYHKDDDRTLEVEAKRPGPQFIHIKDAH